MYAFCSLLIVLLDPAGFAFLKGVIFCFTFLFLFINFSYKLFSNLLVLIAERKMFDLSVHYADYDDQSSEELSSSVETSTKRGSISTRLTTILEEGEVDYFQSLLKSEEEDDATYSITTDSSTVMDETTTSPAGSVFLFVWGPVISPLSLFCVMAYFLSDCHLMLVLV